MWIFDDRDFAPRRPTASSAPRPPLTLSQSAARLLLYAWLLVALPLALLFALFELLGNRAGKLLGAMAAITTVLRRAARSRAALAKVEVSL